MLNYRKLATTVFLLWTLSACSDGSSPVDECLENSELELRSTELPTTTGVEALSVVTIDGIQSVTLGKLLTFADDVVNPVQFFPLLENEEVGVDEVAIQVLLSYQSLENLPVNSFDFIGVLFSYFIPSAIASCAPSSESPILDSGVDLTSLSIISTADLDEDYAAGTNLVEFVKIIELDRFGPNQVGPPKSDSGTTVAELIGSVEQAPLAFILRLDDERFAGKEHLFTVSVTTDNGQKMFVASAPTVSLQ